MAVIDKDRRTPVFKTADVSTITPEWFTADNGKFISFLETYEKFMDSDGGRFNFHQKVQDVFASRDISSVDEDMLDEIISEIGAGLTQSSFFQQPRLMARLLGNFYQQKGTKPSAEGFFRGFFGEEAEIEYPKKDIFFVGQDVIGFDGQKRIQDNKRFQIFSILVKSGISVSDYEILYKRFVHPAGFHFAGDVVTSGNAVVSFVLDSHNPLAVEKIAPIFAPAAPAAFGTDTPFAETTGLYDSSDGTQFRVDLRQAETIRFDDGGSSDSDFTATDFIKYYDDIKTILNPNSFRFDDSANTGRPDFALTVETMDNDVFTRISSDSAI